MTIINIALDADWSTVCTAEVIPNSRRMMTLELIIAEHERSYKTALERSLT
jgi:hypothetical protein